MRELFGARLDQLQRINGLGPEYIALRLVGDMVKATGSTSFDGDEMGALRKLLGLGQDTDPDGSRLRLIVTVLVKALNENNCYVPPIDTMHQKMLEEARRKAEMEQQAKRQQQAQTNFRWAEHIRETMGDGFKSPDELDRAKRAQQRAQMDRMAEALRGKATDALGAAMKRLGLAAGFTTEDLKKAYRDRAKVVHPDTGGSAEAFNQLTKDIEELERVAQSV